MRGIQAVAQLVPVRDLYNISQDDPETVDYVTAAYKVQVVRDHANRPAVTLADAYRIRDAALKAEAELQEHRDAQMSELARLQAAQRARNDWIERNHYRIGVGTPRKDDEEAGQHSQRIIMACRRQVVALEAAAGLPDDVIRRLRFPGHDASYSWEVGTDLEYHLPDDFKGER